MWLGEVERKDRARRIFVGCSEGRTLASLGAEFGLSRERVRQILNKERERIDKELARKAAGDDLSGESFEVLGLSVRTSNCIRNELGAWVTVAEVAEWTERDWLDCDNFGRKSLAELKEVLARHGHRLRE